jgi:hypothetical protein
MEYSRRNNFPASVSKKPPKIQVIESIAPACIPTPIFATLPPQTTCLAPLSCLESVAIDLATGTPLGSIEFGCLSNSFAGYCVRVSPPVIFYLNPKWALQRGRRDGECRGSKIWVQGDMEGVHEGFFCL